MSLGLVCHFIEKKVKKASFEYQNLLCEKSLQLGRYNKKNYTNEQIKSVYVSNAINLSRMAPTIGSFVKCYRMSSSLFPLADKVDRDLWDNDDVKQHLRNAGKIFKSMNVRLTMHPGQFCVLSSSSDNVVQNAIKDLAMHAWILDVMETPCTPYSAINIHGGKSNELKRLMDSIVDLPDNIRLRLTLENDESCYSVVDLLDVYKKTGVPIVFDSHHHTFNDGNLTIHEAFAASCETWRKYDVKPLQHISNSEPHLKQGSFTDRRKHSNYIHEIPDPQFEAILDNKIDLEVESKMKNYAIEKMRSDFNIQF